MYKISEIEKLYPNWYSKDYPMSYNYQKWIWENMPLSEGDENKLKELRTSESVSINGSIIGSHKQQDNFGESLSKHQAIAKLKGCNYRTPPKRVAFYLESLFGRWEENPEIWLRVAQFHTPKTINSVIAQMIKQHQRGDKTFQNPPGYFVKVIKSKPNRKALRDTNGTRKQQNL
ncbi:hypothetical protein HYZ78_03580 [Candidatus Microgenomates bacterium]|nr:hypothetical protein [Candidatus Microgenomates bacterium]